jgi:predicted hydrocarbon binding protein
MTGPTPTKRRIFPIHFAPGKKLFHVVVKLSDAPGSYSAILNLLGPKINLIGTTTYTLSDGTAIFSGFSESLSPNETANSLNRLIMSSKAAIESSVIEGKDGLLIDTFHTGIEVGGSEFLLMRRLGASLMFDHVAKLLGSGGEALLYEEGRSLSLLNAELMIKLVGLQRVRTNSAELSPFLTAQGWGSPEIEGSLGAGNLRVKLNDCFECSAPVTYRKGCNFMRGYFAGSMEASMGGNADAKEVKCTLKGAPSCEFMVTINAKP